MEVTNAWPHLSLLIVTYMYITVYIRQIYMGVFSIFTSTI